MIKDNGRSLSIGGVVSPKRSPDFKADRRGAILAAAERCFIGQGYDRATMREIAREAGVSTGAIYTYFATKAAILAAICNEQAARQQVEIRAALATMPPGGDRFAAAFRAAFEPLLSLPEAEARRRERADLLLWFEAMRDEEVGGTIRRIFGSWRATVLELLREERAAGRLRADLDLDALAAVLEALPLGLPLLDLLGDGRLDWNATLRTLGAVLQRGLAPAGEVERVARNGEREGAGGIATEAAG
jgi:AcrR family transcriptional regulator